MFGPLTPRAAGRAGVPGLPGGGASDPDLPGFGPFGTAGAHCFDPTHPLYRRVSALAATRAAFPVLRAGRQYLRPVSVFGEDFHPAAAGELFGWSRILSDEEALCVLNPHGAAVRGADLLVDAALNPAGSELTVVLNSAEAAGAGGLSHPVGSRLPVLRTPSGAAYVQVRDRRAERVAGAGQPAVGAERTGLRRRGEAQA